MANVDPERICFVCGEAVGADEDLNMHVNLCLDGKKAPKITPSQQPIAYNASTLVIRGTGFSTTPGNNVVAFFGGGAGSASAQVTAATATTLTVAVGGAFAPQGGALQATVAVAEVATSTPQNIGMVLPVPTLRLNVTRDNFYYRFTGTAGDSFQIEFRHENGAAFTMNVNGLRNNNGEIVMSSMGGNQERIASTEVFTQGQPFEFEITVQADAWVLAARNRQVYRYTHKCDATSVNVVEFPASFRLYLTPDAGRDTIPPTPTAGRVPWLEQDLKGVVFRHKVRGNPRVWVVGAFTNPPNTVRIPLDRKINDEYIGLVYMPAGRYLYRILTTAADGNEPIVPSIDIYQETAQTEDKELWNVKNVATDVRVREAEPGVLRHLVDGPLVAPHFEQALAEHLSVFDINATQTDSGMTLLHEAVIKFVSLEENNATAPAQKLIEELLRRGADVMILDRERCRPYDRAIRSVRSAESPLVPMLEPSAEAIQREETDRLEVLKASRMEALTRAQRDAVQRVADARERAKSMPVPTAGAFLTGRTLLERRRLVDGPPSVTVLQDLQGASSSAAAGAGAAPMDAHAQGLHRAISTGDFLGVIRTLETEDPSAPVPAYRQYRYVFSNTKTPNSCVQLCGLLFWRNGLRVVGCTVDNPNGNHTAYGNGVNSVVDGTRTTMWHDCNARNAPHTSTLIFTFPAATAIDQYELVTGTDCVERDPQKWVLSGSNDEGATWVDIDSQEGVALPAARKATSGRFRVGGANIDQPDSWQRSPLMVAAARGHPSIIAYLLFRGANPTIKGRFGNSPLEKAVTSVDDDYSPKPGDGVLAEESHRHFETVRLLLSHALVHRAFLEERKTPMFPQGSEYAINLLGETVLHGVARSGNLALARLILSFETFRRDLNTRNHQGETASDVAVDAAMKQLFTETEALQTGNPNIPNTIRECILGNDLFILQKKLVGNTDIDLPDPSDGLTPLLFAVKRDLVDMVAILLYHGADATVADRQGRTALAWAAVRGNVETMRLLLSNYTVHLVYREKQNYGLDANGETVLHSAARGGNEEAVKVLLAFGTFATYLEHVNNQRQIPAALASTATARAAFTTVLTELAQLRGTPMPKIEDQPTVICAVCLLSPPTPQDEVYTCECGAPFCSECFVHLAQAAIGEGKFPGCCNTACGTRIPMTELFKHMPLTQMRQLVSIMVEEQQSMDAIYKQVCPVCNRSNDMQKVVDSGKPDYLCAHCNVSLCAVCASVYPKSGKQHDEAIHASCLVRFPLMQQFLQFHDLLQVTAVRQCPRCKTRGVKDDACTHMSCQCGAYYCYVCGLNQDEFAQPDMGSHGEGNFEGQWRTDPSRCPMYLPYLAPIDARIGSLGCPNPNCYSGGCTQQEACKKARDRAAQALLATIRVRVAILDAAVGMGKKQFVEMCTQFKWRDLVSNNFFNGKFPWESGDLPDWLDFEPESMRTFYRPRLCWFKRMPADRGAAAAAAGGAGGPVAVEEEVEAEEDMGLGLFD